MSRLLFSLLLLSFSMNCFAQFQATWLKSLGGRGTFTAKEWVIDAQDNLYGIADFYDSIQTTSINSKGLKDILVFKIDAQGQLLWTQHFGGINSDVVEGIAIDSNNNVCISGTFQNTLYYNQDSVVSAGAYDAFVCKINSQGQIQWVKTIGGPQYELGLKASYNSFSDHWIVSGSFEFPFTIDNQMLSSYGGWNNYIVSLDQNGQVVWGESIGTQIFENIRDISCSLSGDIYVLGEYEDFLFSSKDTLNALGDSDIYISKWTSNGDLTWNQSMGGFGRDRATCLNSINDELYFSYAYSDSSKMYNQWYFSDGEFDALLVKVDTSGQLVWVDHYGGNDDIRIDAIQIDQSRDLVVCGTFEGRADIQGDSLISDVPTHVPSDLLIAKHNSSTGQLIELQDFGQIYAETATSMEINSRNQICIFGLYQGNFTVGTESIQSYQQSVDLYFLQLENTLSTLNSRERGILSIGVYPNPTNKYFIINSNSIINRLEIYSMQGQLLHSSSIENRKNISVNCSSWPQGSYLIRCHSRKNIVTKQINIYH